MEHQHNEQPARPTSVNLTPEAAETLEKINLLLRDIGYRVKTAALVECALVELHEQFLEKQNAVAIIRKRVPPHSVVFPP
jgi:hypothetical protein